MVASDKKPQKRRNHKSPAVDARRRAVYQAVNSGQAEPLDLTALDLEVNAMAPLHSACRWTGQRPILGSSSQALVPSTYTVPSRGPCAPMAFPQPAAAPPSSGVVYVLSASTNHGDASPITCSLKLLLEGVPLSDRVTVIGSTDPYMIDSAVLALYIMSVHAAKYKARLGIHPLADSRCGIQLNLGSCGRGLKGSSGGAAMALAMYNLLGLERRSSLGPGTGTVTGTGALDAFGNFTLPVGGLRQKLSAIARVDPGARVGVPSSNWDESGQLMDDNDVQVVPGVADASLQVCAIKSIDDLVHMQFDGASASASVAGEDPPHTSHSGEAQVLVAYLSGPGGHKPLMVKVQAVVFTGVAGQWPPHITLTGIASAAVRSSLVHTADQVLGQLGTAGEPTSKEVLLHIHGCDAMGEAPCSGLGLGVAKAVLEAFQVSLWPGLWGTPTTAYLGDVMGSDLSVMCPDAVRWFGPGYCRLLKQMGIITLILPPDVMRMMQNAIEEAASLGLTLVEAHPLAHMMDACRCRRQAEEAKAAEGRLRRLACGPPCTTTMLDEWLDKRGESVLDTMVGLNPDESDDKEEEEEEQELQHAYAELPSPDHSLLLAQFSAVIRPDLPSPPPCSPYDMYL